MFSDRRLFIPAVNSEFQTKHTMNINSYILTKKSSCLAALHQEDSALLNRLDITILHLNPF